MIYAADALTATTTYCDMQNFEGFCENKYTRYVYYLKWITATSNLTIHFLVVLEL